MSAGILWWAWLSETPQEEFSRQVLGELGTRWLSLGAEVPPYLVAHGPVQVEDLEEALLWAAGLGFVPGAEQPVV